MTKATPEAAVPTPEQTRDTLIRKAYAKAATALREAHKDEFLDLQEKFSAELGVDWKRPEDAEDKAYKQMEALLGQHPDLLTRVWQNYEAPVNAPEA